MWVPHKRTFRFLLFWFYQDYSVGLLLAPGGLSLSMKVNSTGLWTKGVHVNVASATFSNSSGSLVPVPLSISLPLIVCAFVLSLYSLWGVCVRSGSFKHCSNSIASIKGITSQKRGGKNRNTSCFEEYCEAWKSKIYKANVCHIAKQQYHREAYRTTTEKNIPHTYIC